MHTTKAFFSGAAVWALLWLAAADASAGDPATGWALRPLVKPALPASEVITRGTRTPVDAYIRQKLRESDLAPSEPADRRTLLRRATFDLTGLPPSPDDLERFHGDPGPNAFDRELDRLLASPRYGERWARHWMDVVHYAETHGHDEDAIRPNMWPYRDYLIAAFNADKPYGRFVREQVAGDVLYPMIPEATVATAFLATGPWDASSQMGIQDGTIDKERARYLDRDDMIATTMSTFVSATVHCARCHDHKMDPIPTEDYYALQAVFAGVDRVDRPYDPDPGVAARRRSLTNHLAELERGNLPRTPSSARTWKEDVEAALEVPSSERDDTQWKTLALHRALEETERELAALPAPQHVYAVASTFSAKGNFKPAVTPREVRVLDRGEVLSPGPVASPGTLSCVPHLPSRFPSTDGKDEGARRAALAEWLAHSENVLTWRSIANRIWHYHFGSGIVATPNDFGQMGSPPSHPELLDWLACEVRDNGGSLKQLHRLMMGSAVYRQRSSEDNPVGRERDQANRWLWRAPHTRLEAECYRDAVLALSGDLDLEMGGPSARHFNLTKGIHVTPNLDYFGFDPDDPANFRRSVYRFVFRTVPDPLMQSLDCPDASQFTPRRAESTTALQALATLNSPFLVSQSARIAARLERERPGLEAQIELLFHRALQRPPDEEETAVFLDLASQHGLANACRVMINSSEFFYLR